MRILPLLCVLLLAASPTTAQDAQFRLTLPGVILLSGSGPNEGGENGSGTAITASAPQPAAFATVGETLTLVVTHAGGHGGRTLTPTGTLPGLSVSGDTVSALLTTPGSYTVGVTVTDDGTWPSVPLGTWPIDVDQAISVGSVSPLVVAQGVSRDFPLPTATGGFGTLTASIVPEDSRVTVVGDNIRVLAPDAGPVGTFQVKFIDTRPREKLSHGFEVTSLAPLSITAPLPVGYAMVGDAFALPVTHSGGNGSRTVSLVGELPGVTASSTGLSGILTTANSYTFSVSVEDGFSEPDTEGPWTVIVDPALTIGNVPANIDATTGIQLDTPLPARTGNAPVASIIKLSGTLTGVSISGNNIRVNQATAGSGTYLVRLTDARGRTMDSNVFTVSASAPVAPAVYTNESQVASVSTTGVSRGGDNKIATSYRNISHTSSTPGTILAAGQTITVNYATPVKSTHLRVSYTNSNVSCTAPYQQPNTSPVLQIATSMDGTTWQQHTLNVDATTYRGGCGVYGQGLMLDEMTTYKHVKLTLVSAKNAANGDMSMIFFLMRGFSY